MEIYELDLPEYWAHYLINGVHDGLEEWDFLQLAALDSCDALACSNETYFGYYNGIACSIKSFAFALGESK